MKNFRNSIDAASFNIILTFALELLRIIHGITSHLIKKIPNEID